MSRSRTVALAIAMLAVVALISGCIGDDQADALALVRSDRTSHHVHTVAFDESASGSAQAHAADMAVRRSLYHSKLRLDPGQCAKGENVGHGASVAQVEQAFMASPPHRANILNDRFDHVGVGVTRWHGQVWVVQLFVDLC